MTEVLRQACYSSDKIVAIVDREMVPYIEDFWKKLPQQRKLVDLYKSIPSHDDPKMQNKPFVEYVQKHALADVIFNSFISDYFMKHKFFPFNGVGLYGWQTSVHNLEHFWNHFYNKYHDRLGKVLIDPNEGKYF